MGAAARATEQLTNAMGEPTGDGEPDELVVVLPDALNLVFPG